MSAAELLAQLTPHGVRIGHIPGGIPSLTPQDIAAAVALSCTPFEASLLLSRYAHDGQQFREARAYWFEVVMAEKQLRGWTSEEPGQFKALSDATLDEWIGDHRCKACKGTKEAVIDAQKVVCDACGGSGIRYPSDRAMGRSIGVGRTAYANHWKHRVDWCRREILRIEARAVYALGRALYNREPR